MIEGMKFTPQSLVVNRGDTVVWTNRDFFPHNVTAAEGGPQSPDLAAGENWRFQADSEGRFDYVCSLHPTMKGALVVK